MSKRSVVVLVASILILVGSVRAGYYADAIHEWVPGDGVWPESPGDPLGPPDFDVSTDAYGIGRGGVLTLRLAVPFTDGPGMDLTVYEYGSSAGGTNDSYDVAVSASGLAGSFVDVGSTPGDATSFDLAGIGYGPYQYVRITDTDSTTQFDGADIDAAEVLTPANFAASIYEWVPGIGAWPESPGDPLGPPDLDPNGAYGIGQQGSITLKMELPFFDQPGDDLKVYEYGNSVGATDDAFDVSVSTDAQSFFPVGSSSGDHTTFDLANAGLTGPFRYVKIVDTNTSFDGADIDAVQAFTPEPASMSLLALGGLALIRRRRRKESTNSLLGETRRPG